MGSDYLFSSENSIWVSVEDKIRNHRLTDISHNMISGGYEHEVRCKSLPFQHGHWMCRTAAPGWKKNIHRLHRGRGCVGCDHGAEIGVGLSYLQWPTGLCRFDPEWCPRGIFEECDRELWFGGLTGSSNYTKAQCFLGGAALLHLNAWNVIQSLDFL